jgi:hypothetical protein
VLPDLGEVIDALKASSKHQRTSSNASKAHWNKLPGHSLGGTSSATRPGYWLSQAMQAKVRYAAERRPFTTDFHINKRRLNLPQKPVSAVKTFPTTNAKRLT